MQRPLAKKLIANHSSFSLSICTSYCCSESEEGPYLGWNMAAHKVRMFEGEEDLSIALADYIAELSEASIKERGAFTIALSGGPLIRLLGYNHLVFLPFVLITNTTKCPTHPSTHHLLQIELATSNSFHISHFSFFHPIPKILNYDPHQIKALYVSCYHLFSFEFQVYQFYSKGCSTLKEL